MILTAIDPGTGGEMFASLLMILLGLGFCVLYGFLIYWLVKFVITVPSQLKRIAEALEKIAIKQR